MIVQIMLLVVGFLLLIKGADYFVGGASGIATKFKIPQIVIGLTIVAFGTSAPEAAISIQSAMLGQAGISIGNVVGSNIMNILLILGLTALITPVPVKRSTFRYEMPFVVGVTILLLLLGMNQGQVSRLDGGILWIVFLGFFVYLLKLAKSGEETFEEEVMEGSLLKLIVMTLLGLCAIVWGSDLTVDAATKIAEAIGVSDRIMGLTIVAFGTSLPELVTSVTASLKGKTDIAIGNIVGSNIFNILFVIGTASLISPIPFANKFIFDCIVAIATAALLWVLCLPKKKLTRSSGVIMLIAYFMYLSVTIF